MSPSSRDTVPQSTMPIWAQGANPERLDQVRTAFGFLFSDADLAAAQHEETKPCSHGGPASQPTGTTAAPFWFRPGLSQALAQDDPCLIGSEPLPEDVRGDRQEPTSWEALMACVVGQAPRVARHILGTRETTGRIDMKCFASGAALRAMSGDPDSDHVAFYAERLRQAPDILVALLDAHGTGGLMARQDTLHEDLFTLLNFSEYGAADHLVYPPKTSDVADALLVWLERSGARPRTGLARIARDLLVVRSLARCSDRVAREAGAAAGGLDHPALAYGLKHLSFGDLVRLQHRFVWWNIPVNKLAAPEHGVQNRSGWCVASGFAWGKKPSNLVEQIILDGRWLQDGAPGQRFWDSGAQEALAQAMDQPGLLAAGLGHYRHWRNRSTAQKLIRWRGSREVTARLGPIDRPVDRLGNTLAHVAVAACAMYENKEGKLPIFLGPLFPLMHLPNKAGDTAVQNIASARMRAALDQKKLEHALRDDEVNSARAGGNKVADRARRARRV